MDRKPRRVVRCRLWWPLHLRIRCPSLVFGWASNHSDSLDLVVATACSSALLLDSNSPSTFIQLILYDQPKLGSHHFSMQPWSFLSNANEVREHQLPVHPKPDWILELQKREEAPDIDSVILQLNCAVAAEHYIKSLSLTDDLLRTGCIWLMGVPAGFKLNTELAGMLGLFSLNVIQVWSTLVYLLKPLFGPFLYMLALSGMILGITVPAAIIADMLFLVTFHISTLHQLVAFIYSNQLQALAALWRLFRGRKRNALRGRIDTYDCNVEQHVVGSLMFTPLLLLLPTTSVFYIFFTMLFSSLSILRLLLQIFIAIVHCFPYAQVAIWLVQPRRFPSGIWFETLPEVVDPQQDAIHPSKRRNKQRGKKKGSVLQVVTGNLVTVLGINTASIGEILIPSLRQLGGGVTWSSCAFCIYKIFSGERWPASVELGMPVLPPWTTCNIRGFWRLCYDAIIASI